MNEGLRLSTGLVLSLFASTGLAALAERPDTQETVSICSLKWHLWAFQEVKQRRWRPDPVKRSDNEIEADFFMQAYNACSNACVHEEYIAKKAEATAYDDHKAAVEAAVSQYKAYIEDFPALPHFKDANSEATKKRLSGARDAFTEAFRLSAEAAKASFARWEALGARGEVSPDALSGLTEKEIRNLRKRALEEFHRYVAISDEANDSLELRLKAEDKIALNRAWAERRRTHPWIGKSFASFHQATKGSVFHVSSIWTGEKIIVYVWGNSLRAPRKPVNVNAEGIITNYWLPTE